MRRSASVMGKFYPTTSHEMERFILQWRSEKSIPGCRAGIVPHAGYIFSGECAWRTLSKLDWTEFTRVVIIGPSHRLPFSGVSVFTGDTYETIGGEHPYDTAFAQSLVSDLNLKSIEQAHYEHSTEVQVPLIHTLQPQLPVVECVYGERAELKLETLIRHILLVPGTALLISSDLSHFYTEEEAKKLDDHIIEAVETCNVDELQKGEACGKPGIQALINYCHDEHKRLTTVDYRTSADSPMGDSGRVVGYLSAVML